GRLLLEAAPCRFEDAEVGVDGAETMPSESASVFADQPPEVSVGRDENDGPRLREFRRSFALVAMETSDPLQQDVDRAEIGQQEVCVQVEALLYGLGRHGNPASLRTVLPERRLDGTVERFAMFAGISGVVGRGRSLAGEEK